MSLIEIRINGESKQTGSSTVEALLNELGLGDKRVAVELNKEIISRSQYGQIKLEPGDAVEVVHFVGGG